MLAPCATDASCMSSRDDEATDGAWGYSLYYQDAAGELGLFSRFSKNTRFGRRGEWWRSGFSERRAMWLVSEKSTRLWLRRRIYQLLGPPVYRSSMKSAGRFTFPGRHRYGACHGLAFPELSTCTCCFRKSIGNVGRPCGFSIQKDAGGGRENEVRADPCAELDIRHQFLQKEARPRTLGLCNGLNRGIFHRLH